MLFKIAVLAAALTVLCSGSLTASIDHPLQGSTGRIEPADANMAGGPADPIAGLFIKNLGQMSGDVSYYSMGNPAVGFRDDGAMFVLRDEVGAGSLSRLPQSGSVPIEDQLIAHAYLIRFENARKVSPEPIDLAGFEVNFFIGEDEGAWRTGVPVYGGVEYRDIYAGVDAVYSHGDGGVKYEFRLRPGADPDVILMRIEGADSTRLGGNGMEILTKAGTARDSRPYSYLDGGDEIRCDFAARGVDLFGFECEDYDASRQLTIDPLVYSTFLGGNLLDRGYSIKVDSTGSAYVAGQTYSLNFPTTPGAFSTSKRGSDDAFVTKMSPTGDSLVYSTFIGGNQPDVGISVALDSSQNAYVAGVTISSDFPVTPGAYHTALAGNVDVFVAKLNPAGDALLYSTYLGGSENETWPTVDVDSLGCAFIAGGTESADFPVTPGAYDTSFNGGPDDAFVTKLNPSGSSLAYSTFIGGNSNDFAYSIALDSGTGAYVTGGTFSADFALAASGYDKSHNGDSDVFVAKVNATGSALDYATYFGGTGADFGLSVAVDSGGGAHVTGSTDSSDFPTSANAYDKTKNSIPGYNDAFMFELDNSGSTSVYSTYIGGSKWDYGNSIVLDDSDNAYIVGWTGSTDLPATPAAFDATYNGNADFFFLEIDTLGLLANLSYLGGTQTEGDYPFMAVDSHSALYITGITNSTDFPVTPGAFDPTINPVRDAFVTKMGPTLPDLSLNATDISFTPPGPVALGVSVAVQARVHNYGNLDAVDVVVRFHDGPPNGSNQIGVDRVIPLIAANGGTGTASVAWIAQPSGDHDICVVADPDNAIAEMTDGNNMACRNIAVGSYFRLQLQPGHRLISFPLKPLNDAIESILPAISVCYRYVRYYDASDSLDPWKSYMQSKPFNDLTRLDNTMGFWIDIESACELVIAGVLQSSTSINLRQGWNMVGYPSYSTTYTVADLKADIGLPGVRVEVQDLNAGPYYLKQVGDSYVMMAGEGYWIYTPSDATWRV